MRHLLKKLLPSVAVALTVTSSSLPMPARAQTYPIDCAILLCLSGGWPASVPCARARAEFIRRITPWPVEPPLQIWRCPMGASYETSPSSNSADRIFEAFFQNKSAGPQQSFPAQDAATRIEAAWRTPEAPINFVLADRAAQLVQDRADIDISGPEFNFVRSIRVFNVQYARQYQAGSEGDCERSANVVLGTYGTQGEFAWQRTSITALPTAHIGLERWGQNCPGIYHRSVFVDWRDYEGNYGFEQVNY
ncbi:hypothetical protein [Ruegeria sp. MALMAid1280]|uniref:hypothetical protein n=1 Tax=Ruegeria sp. MALMAid1280 TaxID=3411634 RepID=UPI003BA2F156